MYLNIQLGNFHFVVGKPAAKPAKKPMVMQVSAITTEGKDLNQEFIIDDESKLRYQS
jgi:hypothetical protein